MATKYFHKAEIGDGIKSDEWAWFYTLNADNGFRDSSFPGCQFRVKLHDTYNHAVNVKTTGQPRWNGIQWQSRCKIEFVGDGEPSTFAGGLLYHKER